MFKQIKLIWLGWFPPKKRQLSPQVLAKRRLEKLLKRNGISKADANRISYEFFNPL
jgi:hypothetical protein